MKEAIAALVVIVAVLGLVAVYTPYLDPVLKSFGFKLTIMDPTYPIHTVSFWTLRTVSGESVRGNGQFGSFGAICSMGDIQDGQTLYIYRNGALFKQYVPSACTSTVAGNTQVCEWTMPAGTNLVECLTTPKPTCESLGYYTLAQGNMTCTSLIVNTIPCFSCVASNPFCGDGTCQANENHASCPADCQIGQCQDTVRQCGGPCPACSVIPPMTWLDYIIKVISDFFNFVLSSLGGLIPK
jgi:hypothetical protein